MNFDIFFQITIFTTFIGIATIRIYFIQLSKSYNEPAISVSEGYLIGYLRIITSNFLALLVIGYIIYPNFFRSVSIRFPNLIKLLSSLVQLLMVILLWWIHNHLGENFSRTLHIHLNHEFVAQGPYKYVRHPMYSVIFTYILTLFLITGIILILPIIIGYFLTIMIIRTNKEEEMLIEEFGETYIFYMQGTRKFIPKLI